MNVAGVGISLQWAGGAGRAVARRCRAGAGQFRGLKRNACGCWRQGAGIFDGADLEIGQRTKISGPGEDAPTFRCCCRRRTSRRGGCAQCIEFQCVRSRLKYTPAQHVDGTGFISSRLPRLSSMAIVGVFIFGEGGIPVVAAKCKSPLLEGRCALVRSSMSGRITGTTHARGV